MYKNVKPVFFKALSGIHAGTGSDLGLVDLPIQRERHSGLPKIESSGVKGCIREEFEQIADLPADFVRVAFGPEDDGDKHAGSIAFTDARLLLFPVRSAKGVFAYATCPYILNRLREDFAFAGITTEYAAADEKAQVSSDKLLILKSGKVVLEEYTIEAARTEQAAKLAESIAIWLRLDDARYVKDNLIILSDDDFSDFARNNTEIITRVKIDNKTGTVAKGALFTEELLPAETVMYALIMTAKIFISEEARGKSATVRAAGADEGKYLLDVIAEKMPKYIQIGGDATIGKGLCRVSMEGQQYETSRN
ncbi:MAG: type III-B CRISPR module RAMP protein Cmr4 [Gracilibacteraceae bacterium]|jgi:CRISPR-associated protein Cmr4|nr:type III-B CRISPR module RAMP protein Cmr4 [Gracilibacteraceae bacterium]